MEYGTRRVYQARAVEFLPDGKALATAGSAILEEKKRSEAEVRLHDVKNGSLKKILKGKAQAYSLIQGTFTCSHDGKYIAAAGLTEKREWIVDVFDAIALKHTHTLKGEASNVTGIKFSPTTKTLAVAHTKGAIEFWNPESGKKAGSFTVNGEGVGGLAYSPDGSFIAVGNHGGSVTFHDSATGEELGKIPARSRLISIAAVAFSPDGKLLATGGWPSNEMGQLDSPVILWEIEKNENDKEVAAALKTDFQGHHRHTYSVVFSPDGKFLASANQDKTVRIWNIGATEELLMSITDHTDFTHDAAFSPDGKLLATLGRDSLKLWRFKEQPDSKQ